MKHGITVAYSGVHQAYQLALAANELQQLDYFYCSLFAAPGKWGGMLVRLAGTDLLVNRCIDGLPPTKVREYPWPVIAHRCRSRLFRKSRNHWVFANSWFDHWVARRLQKSTCAVFVGTETCAADSFVVARQRGMIRVLDCPGIDAGFLTKLAMNAGAEFGIASISHADSPEMVERKLLEVELADVIFVCSELQARFINRRHSRVKQVHVLPLWADTSFWYPVDENEDQRSGPLRVLFVGKINLRKGVPYLVRAAVECNVNVALTLVGNVEDELMPCLKCYDEKIKLLPPCSKIELRKQYHAHDVLVLPSLGDSFGFVAMEAMACGLPVIVTENCGVPVPDPSWRVPIMDSDAIARRLTLYAEDRELCREHGLLAAEFARRYTPQGYREQIKSLYRQLLAEGSSAELDSSPGDAISYPSDSDIYK